MRTQPTSDPNLAVAITRAASMQTACTIRFLADRDRKDNAYRAYAYFRWLDDWLDQDGLPQTERLAFVRRQQALVDALYRGERPEGLAPEESLLAGLVRSDEGSGLCLYIRNLMAVMAFDARRRGRLIEQGELDEYTRWLAVAVTEALHHFIGHGLASPQDETRYLAVTGAHITHLLRDTLEDLEAGYYNIPRQVLAAGGVTPADVASPPYRRWVQARVRAARQCFRLGRGYLARVESLRCRIAGYAYIHRFESVLDTIEREGFSLRPAYPECKGPTRGARMLGWALWMALARPQSFRSPRPVTP